MMKTIYLIERLKNEQIRYEYKFLKLLREGTFNERKWCEVFDSVFGPSTKDAISKKLSYLANHQPRNIPPEESDRLYAGLREKLFYHILSFEESWVSLGGNIDKLWKSILNQWISSSKKRQSLLDFISSLVDQYLFSYQMEGELQDYKYIIKLNRSLHWKKP